VSGTSRFVLLREDVVDRVGLEEARHAAARVLDGQRVAVLVDRPVVVVAPVDAEARLDEEALQARSVVALEDDRHRASSTRSGGSYHHELAGERVHRIAATPELR
jgi:hypothetical protein